MEIKELFSNVKATIENTSIISKNTEEAIEIANILKKLGFEEEENINRVFNLKIDVYFCSKNTIESDVVLTLQDLEKLLIKKLMW